MPPDLNPLLLLNVLEILLLLAAGGGLLWAGTHAIPWRGSARLRAVEAALAGSAADRAQLNAQVRRLADRFAALEAQAETARQEQELLRKEQIAQQALLHRIAMRLHRQTAAIDRLAVVVQHLETGEQIAARLTQLLAPPGGRGTHYTIGTVESGRDGNLGSNLGSTIHHPHEGD